MRPPDFILDISSGDQAAIYRSWKLIMTSLGNLLRERNSPRIELENVPLDSNGATDRRVGEARRALLPSQNEYALIQLIGEDGVSATLVLSLHDLYVNGFILHNMSPSNFDISDVGKLQELEASKNIKSANADFHDIRKKFPNQMNTQDSNIYFRFTDAAIASIEGATTYTLPYESRYPQTVSEGKFALGMNEFQFAISYPTMGARYWRTFFSHMQEVLTPIHTLAIMISESARFVTIRNLVNRLLRDGVSENLSAYDAKLIKSWDTLSKQVHNCVTQSEAGPSRRYTLDVNRNLPSPIVIERTANRSDDVTITNVLGLLLIVALLSPFPS